jgi:predicted DNA-binding ArsR family transcriptional regulator
MTTEDDFVALYSAPEGGSDRKASKPVSATIQLNVTEDDEDLFRKLYGDSLPEDQVQEQEEEAEKISEEMNDDKTNIVLHRTWGILDV